MVSARDYEYRVKWSEQDKEYVGTCLQFPSLSWMSVDDCEALIGIVSLVAESLFDMRSTGETPPTPPEGEP